MIKKLLLADDSITIQKVMQITFAHEDYQLTITDNGDVAFAQTRELVPDLVIADVYMPGRNGYELCAAIKEDPQLRHIPVLLLAGSFEPFDEGRAREAGADGWIEKPFESQALIEKVSDLLAAAPPAVVAEAAEAVSAAVPATPAVATETFADFTFEEAVAAAAEPTEFVFEDLAGNDTEFTFSDEPLAVESGFAAAVAVEPFPADVPASPGVGEEILPLDDDDILGGEDLEPLEELSTLKPWSRSAASAEEPFPAFAEVELEAVSVAAPQPVGEPLEVPERPTEPSAAGQRMLALSEEELEIIVERAVTRALAKLAGSTLERVAWEVVPDLAESLIKEEIRQIKEGVG